MRAFPFAAVAALVVSTAVVFAPSADAAAIVPDIQENAAARTAVLEFSGGQSDIAFVPADFAQVEGYEPAVVDGLLVNPGGDCSSPVTLPAEFDLACKAHDLGYDLLRYAAERGQPLGPWARQSIDAALEQRMHESCSARTDVLSRTRCQVMASIATAAVDLNSIRQDYGVPVHEAAFDDSESGDGNQPLRIALLAAAATLTLALLRAVVARRRSDTRKER
ncbi:hypothetical protein [Nocardia huaxiensis]|uniref:hypothetical protein n=1 Tax=Nocardia huaxiensis TaxID=2755382 RepID=UPI001E3E8FA8|nr:hypothetical protein [Nocardia huaxiensis]UFS96369.1 hypothetical protein LPY97_38050 [Nocardia huaxiensis]